MGKKRKVLGEDNSANPTWGHREKPDLREGRKNMRTEKVMEKGKHKKGNKILRASTEIIGGQSFLGKGKEKAARRKALKRRERTQENFRKKKRGEGLRFLVILERTRAARSYR